MLEGGTISNISLHGDDKVNVLIAQIKVKKLYESFMSLSCPFLFLFHLKIHIHTCRDGFR